MSLYSVVIPVYKSSKSLEVIAKQLFDLQEKNSYDFEIIFVNDSPFFVDTIHSLEKIKKKDSRVKVLQLRKNQGQHIATLLGLSMAKGEYIITMDDDLQHPVAEIPKLIESIQNCNVEGVFAIPNYRNRKHSYWRSFASYLLKKSDSIFLKKPKGLILSSYRIMTKELAQVTVNSYNAMPAVSSLMLNATTNLKNVKVEHNAREYGDTNYTVSKLISLALNGILYYSSLPLRILGIVGIIGFLSSMIFIISIIVRKLVVGIDFPGYASTVTLN